MSKTRLSGCGLARSGDFIRMTNLDLIDVDQIDVDQVQVCYSHEISAALIKFTFVILMKSQLRANPHSESLVLLESTSTLVHMTTGHQSEELHVDEEASCRTSTKHKRFAQTTEDGVDSSVLC
jgi:hypothetical protein